MTLNEIINAMANIKKGRITKVVYKSSNNGYEKITTAYVRFVKHENTKDFKALNRPLQARANETHLANCESVIYNSNTQQHYLQMHTTKNSKLKAKSIFKFLGQVIDRATYELANPKKQPSKSSNIFTKKIQDIISIG